MAVSHHHCTALGSQEELTQLYSHICTLSLPGNTAFRAIVRTKIKVVFTEHSKQ